MSETVSASAARHRRRAAPRLASCERGSVLVEAALIIPILMALVVGMFELTRTIVRYQMVDKGVRAGARYLARVPESAVPTWGIQRARCVATRGVASNESTCDSVGKCIAIGWCDATARAGITHELLVASSPKKVRLVANVTLASPLLAFFNRSGAVTVRVDHEEPFISE
ncbi:MAG: pilus assembly protein [Beijerinckiaceae bacterium]|nr:pilus assembly protein [Beijerinckiaceae bacterium]